MICYCPVEIAADVIVWSGIWLMVLLILKGIYNL